MKSMKTFGIFFIIAAFLAISQFSFASAEPDLILNSIEISPLSTMIEGDSVSFEITLSNTGDNSSGSFSLYIDNGDGTNRTYSLPALPSGFQIVRWHSNTYSNAGNYNLTASLIYSGSEISKTNNNKTISFEIKSSSSVQNDFSVDGINVLTPVVLGDEVDFEIIASNNGSTANNVAFYINYGNGTQETKTLNFSADETKNIDVSATYSTAGDHYITAVIDYGNSFSEFDEMNNAVTMKINAILNPPAISISYWLFPTELAAGESGLFSIVLSNAGTGAAYDVSGITSISSIIDTFLYSVIDAGASETRNFSASSQYCGTNTMSSTVNYKDAGNNTYQATTNRTFNVVGSDLEITNFDVSDNDVYVGDNIKFTVEVKNNASDARNVAVKIYKEDTLIKTIDFGNISAGSTDEETVEWEVSGSEDTYDFKAVVDSDNECSNNNNNEEIIEIEIREKSSSGGGSSSSTGTTGTTSSTTSSTGTTGTTSLAANDQEEENEMALAVPATAIALEAIVLALIAVYVVRRKKRK